MKEMLEIWRSLSHAERLAFICESGIGAAIVGIFVVAGLLIV